MLSETALFRLAIASATVFYLGCDLSRPTGVPVSATATDTADVPQSNLMFPDYETQAPAIETSHWHTAAEAKLSDSSNVIGVMIAGEPRAFSIWRLSGIKTHLALDVSDKQNVLVTYCDRTECIRVFDAQQQQAQSLVMRGWHNGEMQLEINGQVYAQSSAQIPLDQMPFERMTWGQWKVEHPTTLLFE